MAAEGRFVTLGALEQEHLEVPSQSTSTVFSGRCPEKWLRSRVATVLRANPWLAGRLRTDPSSGKPALWVPDHVDEEGFLQIARVADPEHVVSNPWPSHFVLSGSALLDCDDEPVCKMVVLLEPTEQQWGLNFSMSHMVTDAHTFYTIYGMLDQASGVVRPMQVDRIHFDFTAVLPDALTHQKRQELLESQGKHQPTAINCCIRYVCQKWLRKQKEAYAAKIDADAASITVNDLLTSWFFKATQPAYGALSFNLRGKGKVPGLSEDHAGVYSTELVLLPEEYMSPVNIHRAIVSASSHQPRHSESSVQGLCGKRGVVTSWHNIYKDVQMPGCTQKVHVPCGPATLSSDLPPVPFATIFRPAADTYAMLTFTEQNLDDLPDTPLGDPLWGVEAAASNFERVSRLLHMQHC
ncbi:unnamed protein product [Symbiodinium natans]|uniref:Uncharacterized protein n=1 Tax=Symbiodinium natans TaxID=878477 RepID=A0A812R326_9DINO|nr:unnamed protein product [Symbiodinium natans]